MKEKNSIQFFDKILDDDEEIVKIFKPNKSKFLWSTFISSVLCFVWIFAFFTIMLVVPDEGGEVVPKIYLLIPLGTFILLEVIIMLFSLAYYNNLYYAYTNKRIIVRSGIFGVDFKSLDMAMIGAISVNVSLLDKILKKDTGSLSFGSTASPITNQSGGAIYKFNHILNPYETCKEIKSYIDKYKNKFTNK